MIRETLEPLSRAIAVVVSSGTSKQVLTLVRKNSGEKMVITNSSKCYSKFVPRPGPCRLWLQRNTDFRFSAWMDHTGLDQWEYLSEHYMPKFSRNPHTGLVFSGLQNQPALGVNSAEFSQLHKIVFEDTHNG